MRWAEGHGSVRGRGRRAGTAGGSRPCAPRLCVLCALLAILCAGLLPLLITSGCGQQRVAELNLYAAAGLKQPMDEVIAIFEKETGVKVIPNYAASGQLYTQIKEGQPCDLYFSADWMYIEKLREEGKVAADQKFLQDNLVLIVSQSARSRVKTVQDLVKPGVTVGVCDPNAPVGVYAERALKKLGLWDQLNTSGNLKARPSTVNQLAIMVQKDQLDAGLIFSSVAKAFGLEPVQVIPQEYTGEIVFGVAIIKGGKEELARKFLDAANQHIDAFTKLGWRPYQK